MSCEFCNNFDFTSVAVKENSIRTAGGSSRFTDTAYDGMSYQLFQFCPVCGSSLLYERPSNNKVPAHSNTSVKVAVDDMGQCIPFALYDTDQVLSEEAYRTISDLRADTGCSFSAAKKAYEYVQKTNGTYTEMLFCCRGFMNCDNIHDSAKFFHELMGLDK